MEIIQLNSENGFSIATSYSTSLNGKALSLLNYKQKTFLFFLVDGVLKDENGSTIYTSSNPNGLDVVAVALDSSTLPFVSLN